MADEPALPVAAGRDKDERRRLMGKCALAVVGIMSTLLVYGVLQEKLMRVPYGAEKEFFRYSLFLVFCNRITTSMVSALILLSSKKSTDPVAPIQKYCVVSFSNILTTTCQYEALKYVSFPVQTLAKCAKMIPVMVKEVTIKDGKIVYKLRVKITMQNDSEALSSSDTTIWPLAFISQIWGTIIMKKKYGGKDYFFAVIVTMGCSLFILYPESMDVSPLNKGRESTVWGVSLMLGYLGFVKFVDFTDLFDIFDGFTSTFQDKLFKGYEMEIHNQIFYTTMCSCVISLSGLILQNHLLPAVDFMVRHPDCFYDVLILSTVATASQFFISYTIRTFGALTFATIMTTRQLVSILLSCVWFVHPLSWMQWVGAAIVFGALYAKTFSRSKPQKAAVTSSPSQGSAPNAANS